MGNTCSCIRHLNDVFLVLRGGLVESGHGEIAPAGLGCERGSGSDYALERCEGRESCEVATSSGMVTSDVEDSIEHSKSHWSELTQGGFDVEDEKVVEENKEVFKELQSHPTWCHFFVTFGYDTKEWLRRGELVVGEKFAEGGQAELFHAKVIWRNRKRNENDLDMGVEYVVKVFKKGTRLRELQAQWPHGYLQWWAEELDRQNQGLPLQPRYRCAVIHGTLLEDGRFAFLMVKEHGDLRSEINRAMMDVENGHGPFSRDEVERIMFVIALGMDWLHKHNIVHRDLKASNVLVSVSGRGLPAYLVADFECSIGVVGTGFFRAPKVLQAIIEKRASSDMSVFTQEAVVYSYGMVCYEVLSGKLPFESHRSNEYGIVLRGERPRIPDYVDIWMKDMLNRCWDVDCSKRPLFPEIIEILSSNSAIVRDWQIDIKKAVEDQNRKHEERLLQMRFGC